VLFVIFMKKNTLRTKSLHLNVETLRQLDAVGLRHIVGGAAAADGGGEDIIPPATYNCSFKKCY
jgi:hypothetical protein